MNNFTRTMALELAEHRIRVNAIAPDHTVTPGIMGNSTGPVDESKWLQISPEMKAARNRGIPLGRTGIPEECGDAAVFLCSAMSAYVTGTIMPVDGGTWASSGWTLTEEGRWTLNASAPTI
jgi:NAD(P)-dependent dehydrogenase (short-subunit alcohol dehydrogenase family)